MLIFLLVLSLNQIFVTTWLIHGSLYRGPITLLEPLVVLIGCHIGSDGWSKVAIRVIWRLRAPACEMLSIHFCNSLVKIVCTFVNVSHALPLRANLYPNIYLPLELFHSTRLL